MLTPISNSRGNVVTTDWSVPRLVNLVRHPRSCLIDAMTVFDPIGANRPMSLSGNGEIRRLIES
jgi:hypothetical protein